MVKTAQRWSIAFLYGGLCFAIGLQAFAFLPWAAPSVPSAAVLDGFPFRVPPQDFAAAFAIAMIPLLSSRWIRRRVPWTYGIGAWLWCAANAIGGPATLVLRSNVALTDGALRVGLAVWALLWMDTALLALWSLRARDAGGARRWMYRSVALTCAAVASRWWWSSFAVPAPLGGREGFAIAWLLWPFSLAVCEALLRRPWIRFGTADRPTAYSLFGA